MKFVMFDPIKHQGMFEKGRLYELQDRFDNVYSVVSNWVKVTDNLVYQEALNNPIFFAVEVE